MSESGRMTPFAGKTLQLLCVVLSHSSRGRGIRVLASYIKMAVTQSNLEKETHISKLPPAENSTEDLASSKRQVLWRNNDFRPQAAGAAILLANQYFQGKEDLVSPGLDISIMKDLLHRLNFATAWKSLNSSVEKRQAQSMLSDITALKLDDYQCFLFYYSGHADAGGIVLPDCHAIKYLEIIQSVCSCESLKDKPKIFIFDCARIVVHSLDQKRILKANIPPHCYVVFSASHDCTAFGDRHKGSFFTCELERAIARQNDRVDLMGALYEAKVEVSEYVPRRSKGRFSQEPEIISSLEKDTNLVFQLGNQPF